MSDPVIKYGDSVIQHGKENDRVYLMKLSTNDMSHILQHIDQLAAVHDYTKSFAKIPCAARDCFIDNGYVQEVCIPKFFNNKEDGCLMGKFYKQKREIEQHPDKAQQVVRVALKKKEACNKQLSTAYSVKKMTEEDVVQMAELYGEVFATYPFPIHQTDYLLKTMRSNVVYFGVRHGEKLVAISSAELYENQSNAEMTDFATLPSYRGQGLALCLLGKMEEELKRRSIHMAYTIARAYSFGMNITFAKAGYNYAGALTNNTNIGGQIESMNVWYKTIAT